MNSSLMDEAVAVESGGMRQPAGGKAVAEENWINSDSIVAGIANTLADNFRHNRQADS